ncbi:helix-turn-helix domain-containing protein [Leisingera caerulea]|uniref:helix-turn-helix domain-containing protein n=1 Tax=Leisingera caerulea TaxID=506591 RepID=UPI00055B4A87|nr:helix-turn-helix transcriptional regulator [Leisingera caerulea]
MRQLSTYLKKNRIRQSEFADSVGVTQGVISRLSSGAAKPSLELAVRIDKATAGAVPVHCWVELLVDRVPAVRAGAGEVLEAPKQAESGEAAA